MNFAIAFILGFALGFAMCGSFYDWFYFALSVRSFSDYITRSFWFFLCFATPLFIVKSKSLNIEAGAIQYLLGAGTEGKGILYWFTQKILSGVRTGDKKADGVVGQFSQKMSKVVTTEKNSRKYGSTLLSVEDETEVLQMAKLF